MVSNQEVVSYVLLRNNQILVDGKLIFEKKDVSSTDFLNAAYEALQINYPKFYKMDNLCKTGFLTAEMLIRGQNLKEEFKPEETGIIVSNANSSLDTDLRYELSTATMPSPALFVYTLPNVLIGELCIRPQIKGESAGFVGGNGRAGGAVSDRVGEVDDRAFADGRGGGGFHQDAAGDAGGGAAAVDSF